MEPFGRSVLIFQPSDEVIGPRVIADADPQGVFAIVHNHSHTRAQTTLHPFEPFLDHAEGGQFDVGGQASHRPGDLQFSLDPAQSIHLGEKPAQGRDQNEVTRTVSPQLAAHALHISQSVRQSLTNSIQKDLVSRIEPAAGGYEVIDFGRERGKVLHGSRLQSLHHTTPLFLLGPVYLLKVEARVILNELLFC